MTKHGLYQKLILDHGKDPRNHRKMDQATHVAEGDNPFCGDQFDVFLNIENEVLKDVSFTGTGCAVSTASASLMTKFLKDKTKNEAIEAFERFTYLLTDADEIDEVEEKELLGKIVALLGVREFPMRIKCASLPWHTAMAALRGKDRTSTE
jgi:nitrogen fixation NifU-like protein